MTAKKFLTILLILLDISAYAKPSVVPTEKGVSLLLAQYRAAHIKDVTYSLNINIPPSKKERIRGCVAITFVWHGKENLEIDFQGEQDQLGTTICVNEKDIPTVYTHEHIIVPAKRLLKGKNKIIINFVAGDKALNRHDEYLYTLFVPCNARTVFPCFDQPDLKALFKLKLNVPKGWKSIHSCDDKPIPTYLFSFTAGVFKEKTAWRDGNEIRALYRETDSAKVAQLDKIFDEISLSLNWLGRYTGIPCPFKKYGFAVLSGFQFGGMEHPGAILYNDRTMFLGKNPTPDEEFNRFSLLAHETSHLWFGDLVTMRWFNDVWTKEVFANYMAYKISREQFPDIDHELNFLKAYQIAALSTDRTDGTHPIQQPLANMNQAGLLYGNIIYNKAPVMMRKMERQMGAENFQKGLQTYLKKYAYGNATWDDLIHIFNATSPSAYIENFSKVWVKEKGLLSITYSVQGSGNNCILTVRQSDPYGRGLVWPQKFKMGILNQNLSDGTVRMDTVNIDLQQSELSVSISGKPVLVYPNITGEGYGRFFFRDSIEIRKAIAGRSCLQQPINKYAFYMALYENFLEHRLSAKELWNVMIEEISAEKSPLLLSTCIQYAESVMRDLTDGDRLLAERQLFAMSKEHPVIPARQQIARLIYEAATDSVVIDSVYNIWQSQSDTLMGERDYTNMAYHLAIARPSKWKQIIDTQRTRVTGADRLHEFDFISRACNPDTTILQQLFNSLLKQENRQVEPWARSVMSLLNAPLREPFSNRFITPSLDELQEIQRTGDIFFPIHWLSSLLYGHKSEAAKMLVKDWIAAHPDYPQPLMNKIKGNAFRLLNQP